MVIPFISSRSGWDEGSYTFRLDQLRRGLQAFGVKTDFVPIGDAYLSRLPVCTPLKIARFFKKFRGRTILHAGDVEACYFVHIEKLLRRHIVVYDIHSHSIHEAILRRKNLWDPRFNLGILEYVFMENVALQSDYFIATGVPLREYYIKRGVDPEKIELVRNSVDLELFVPKKMHREDDDFIITYAGGYQRYQGIDLLVKGMKEIKEPRVKLKLIGFTSKHSDLKKFLVKELGERVVLLDRMPKDRLIDELRESDALLLPRHPWIIWNTNTKFAEYLALAKPIITNDVGETGRIVKKYKCGFVCESTGFAEAIIEAANTSPKTLRIMGRNARRLAELEFDLRKVGKIYFEFLRRIVKEKGISF